MRLSVELSREEKQTVKSYAKRHSISVEEAFKRALFERIEDEYDITVAEEAYREYLDNPKTYSHDEVKEILGI